MKETHWFREFSPDAREGFAMLAEIKPDFARVTTILTEMWSLGVMDRELLIKVVRYSFSNYYRDAVADFASRLPKTLPGQALSLHEVARVLERAKTAIREA